MSTEQRRAVVIGAGLAGLACARELRQKGWKVVVIEARDRVGGRVWTDHFLNGAAVDVGASFIHGIIDNPVAQIATSQGLDLHERLTCPLYDNDGSILDTDFDKQVEDEFNSMLSRAAKRKESKKNDPDESLEEALHLSEDKDHRMSKKERRAYNWHLSNLEYSVNADLDQVRNSGWDFDDAYGLEGAHCVVSHGMGRIADSLAEGLDEENLLLDCLVKRIIYHPNGVRVEVMKKQEQQEQKTNEDVRSTRQSTQRNENGGHYVLTSIPGDICVVTVSLGVLKSKAIAFCPELPALKKSAIDRLGFGLLNKIALLFPYKFWGDDCEIFGWCSEKRGEMPIFVDLSHDGMPVLCVLVSGTPAEQLERDLDSPDSTYMKTIGTILRKIFKDIPPILEMKVSSWKDDKLACGSYSFVAVGSTPQDYDILAAPSSSSRNGVPRLFFAGEATNKLYPASVHGAFLSGIREAQRVDCIFPPSRRSGSSAQRTASKILTNENRLLDAELPAEIDEITEDIFRKYFFPKHSFPVDEKQMKGSIYTSAAASNHGKNSLPTSPRAGGKRGRGRNPTPSSIMVSTPVSDRKKTKRVKHEELASGDRVEIAWKDGRYYPAWVSAISKNGNRLLSHVYYDDGSYELIDMAHVKWRHE